MKRRPPTSTPFPYPTLFRSHVREDTVILLSDVAELAEDIDVDRARRAKEAAGGKGGDEDDEEAQAALRRAEVRDRKSTRLNSSHANISYAVFCLKNIKSHIQ